MRNPKIKIFLTIFFFTFSSNILAQCAMCRAALESEGNVKKGEAVNDGIVYLMAFPYILVALSAFVVYKMFTKKTIK